jgi:hypothetical protein
LLSELSRHGDQGDEREDRHLGPRADAARSATGAMHAPVDVAEHVAPDVLHVSVLRFEHDVRAEKSGAEQHELAGVDSVVHDDMVRSWRPGPDHPDRGDPVNHPVG